jgi:hypothetical protein
MKLKNKIQLKKYKNKKSNRNKKMIIKFNKTIIKNEISSNEIEKKN